MESSPQPHWAALMPLPRYALGEVVKAPISTEADSVSNVANSSAMAVKNEVKGLKWLEYGERIWARLWFYATPLPFSTPEVDAAIIGPIYRTWECPGVPNQKPPSYDVAERKVHALLAANQYPTNIQLGNNGDVGEVGSIYIFQVLNLFLRMRYTNKLLEPIVPNPGLADNAIQPDLKFITSSNPVGLTPAQAAETYDIFYPCWTTPVKKNLTCGNSPKASGLADRILLREPKAVIGLSQEAAGRTNVAFSELKTFWAYPNSSLMDFLDGVQTVLDQEGGSVGIDAVRNTETKPTINLLRQLWGQSYFLGSQIGFVSNLQGVMILLKDSTPGRSSFVMSSILSWTDPRLLTCLIGLSFIAVDVENWRVANPALSLLQMLAPRGQANPVLLYLPERRFVLPQRLQNVGLADKLAKQVQMENLANAGILLDLDDNGEHDIRKLGKVLSGHMNTQNPL